MATYRATLVTFSAGSYTASVRIANSPSVTLDGVRVSRGLPAAEMLPNRALLIDTGDHGDLADVVVYAVLG